MTKRIVAAHWLQVNGRQQKQPNSKTQTEHWPQPTANQSKPTRRNFKNLFKRGSR